MNKSAGTLLIVDDDASVRTSLARLARSVGFEAITFASGEELMAALPTCQHMVCAIVDIHMPGMDGVQLSKKLATEAPWLPVILITAFADLASLPQLGQHEPRALLKKPFDESTLLKAVTNALSPSRADGSDGQSKSS